MESGLTDSLFLLNALRAQTAFIKTTYDISLDSQISLLRPADSLFNSITDWLDGNKNGNHVITDVCFFFLSGRRQDH